MKLPLLATASILLTTAAVSHASAQTSPPPKWANSERETLQHFQAILQIDTRNPAGDERHAADYIKSVFD